MTNIQKSDITFICSGKIFAGKKFNTLASIKSVKKYFPESKIILSTWEGENIEPFEKFCDLIILNPCMEMKYHTCLESCSWYPKLNSYDLQQKSVNAALRQCKTKYAVRFRTDFVLKNDNFLKKYIEFENIFDRFVPEYKIFQNKVLIHQTGTISPYTKDVPMLHHPSELFHFGLTEDLLKIWTGKNMPEKIADYFHDKNHNESNPCLFNHRYTPEQYIWLKMLDDSGVGYEKPDYYLSFSEKMKQEQDRLFISNFIILDAQGLGISSKFDEKLKHVQHRFYDLETYIKQYQKYIVSTPDKTLLLNQLTLQCKIKSYWKKLHKHGDRIAYPLKSALRWFSEIFSFFSYSLKLISLYLKLFSSKLRF